MQTEPRRERVEAGERVHERRLAGARRAHDRGEPAGREVDGDAVERTDLGLALAVDLGGVDGAGGDGERTWWTGLGRGLGGCEERCHVRHDAPIGRPGSSARTSLGVSPRGWHVRAHASRRVHLGMYAAIGLEVDARAATLPSYREGVEWSRRRSRCG